MRVKTLQKHVPTYVVEYRLNLYIYIYIYKCVCALHIIIYYIILAGTYAEKRLAIFASLVVYSS